MKLCLVLDIGNTNMTIGMYAGTTLVRVWRIRTDRQMTADELGLQLLALQQGTDVADIKVAVCVISCVVPPMLSTAVRAAKTYFQVNPLVVGPGIRTGIPIRYEDPREVGADRIANAVAVVHRQQSPAIIVDLGTATTLSVIDERGQYLGGAIAPGIGIAAQALFTNASRLPEVELNWPSQLVQRNTVLGMQAGILFGAAAQVDGLVRRICKECSLPFTVVATGGLSSLLKGHVETVHLIEPYLTLEGLRLLAERN
ncbi:type III pantothenate kinase [Alicyclobacillus fodiniaquatilis]|jgi:type III pantothenate kinase|uniref:Type III pantothenate kinase n=1 Tax=Alicyclobacillus fodiniaquatilis TaxID=1661150 RepID=A0ABW4JF23_9BACL